MVAGTLWTLHPAGRIALSYLLSSIHYPV
jgi:hypothetical protein